MFVLGGSDLCSRGLNCEGFGLLDVWYWERCLGSGLREWVIGP